MTLIKKIVFFSLLLSCFFADQPKVHAQGGLGLNIGGVDAGPMISNPAAVFWNPAAIGPLKGFHLLADIETVFGQGEYLRAPDANHFYYDPVKANVLFPSPFIGMTNNFGLERWNFGLAIYMPFGSGGQYKPEDGAQRYHLIQGTEASLFLTTSISYQVTPKFYIGLGTSYVFTFLQGSVAIDLATTVQNILPAGFGIVEPENPLFEAYAKTGLMTGHNFTFNTGMFYRHSDELDFGLSFLYPISIGVTGNIEVTLPNAGLQAEPLLQSLLGFDGRTVKASGRISTYRPAKLMGGMHWRAFDDISLVFMGIYSFSSFRDAFVTELYNTGIPFLDAPEGTSVRASGATNSYSVKVGGTYDINKKIDLGGYLTYIDGGVRSSHTTPVNVGFDAIAPSFLFEYFFKPHKSLSFSLTSIFAFERNITDSIFDPYAFAGSGVGLPSANGRYRGYGIQFGINYKHKF